MRMLSSCLFKINTNYSYLQEEYQVTQEIPSCIPLLSYFDLSIVVRKGVQLAVLE
jgi:hypothetical protein